MATLTLYRPIGTAEAALIADLGWKSFPPMPEGFGFYAYPQPPNDPRSWSAELSIPEMYDALEYGQQEVVDSWEAWGNAPDNFFVIWFEVDERLRPSLHRPLDIEIVNQSLRGSIEVCARYSHAGVWVHPQLKGHR